MFKNWKKYINKDSITHFMFNLVPSIACGWYGVCAAVGGSLTKGWCEKNRTKNWPWINLCADLAGIILGIGLHLLLV